MPFVVMWIRSRVGCEESQFVMMVESEREPLTGRGLGGRVALLLHGKLGGRAALSILMPVGMHSSIERPCNPKGVLYKPGRGTRLPHRLAAFALLLPPFFSTFSVSRWNTAVPPGGRGRVSRRWTVRPLLVVGPRNGRSAARVVIYPPVVSPRRDRSGPAGGARGSPHHPGGGDGEALCRRRGGGGAGGGGCTHSRAAGGGGPAVCR